MHHARQTGATHLMLLSSASTCYVTISFRTRPDILNPSPMLVHLSSSRLHRKIMICQKTLFLLISNVPNISICDGILAWECRCHVLNNSKAAPSVDLMLNHGNTSTSAECIAIYIALYTHTYPTNLMRFKLSTSTLFPYVKLVGLISFFFNKSYV